MEEEQIIDFSGMYFLIAIIVLGILVFVLSIILANKKNPIAAKTGSIFGLRKYYFLETRYGTQKIEEWQDVPPDKVMLHLSDGSRPIYRWKELTQKDTRNAFAENNVIYEVKNEVNITRPGREGIFGTGTETETRTEQHSDAERRWGFTQSPEQIDAARWENQAKRASGTIHTEAERAVEHAERLTKARIPDKTMGTMGA